jgi:adenylate kinase
VHISTGDILRQAIEDQTPEGKLAQPYMAKGNLVPDAVVNEIVAARFRSKDCPKEFVLDGYPRTVEQARALDRVLKEQNLELDAVVFLAVDDAEIVKRLAGRWNCPNPHCRATYNTFNKKPRVDNLCDECQTALMQREDDREETVRRRLAVFHQVNADLLRYYRDQGLLLEIPATGDIEAIYAEIAKRLGERRKV